MKCHHEARGNQSPDPVHPVCQLYVFVCVLFISNQWTWKIWWFGKVLVFDVVPSEQGGFNYGVFMFSLPWPFKHSGFFPQSKDLQNRLFDNFKVLGYMVVFAFCVGPAMNWCLVWCVTPFLPELICDSASTQRERWYKIDAWILQERNCVVSLGIGPCNQRTPAYMTWSSRALVYCRAERAWRALQELVWPHSVNSGALAFKSSLPVCQQLFHHSRWPLLKRRCFLSGWTCQPWSDQTLVSSKFPAANDSTYLFCRFDMLAFSH